MCMSWIWDLIWTKKNVGTAGFSVDVSCFYRAIELVILPAVSGRNARVIHHQLGSTTRSDTDHVPYIPSYPYIIYELLPHEL